LRKTQGQDCAMQFLGDLFAIGHADFEWSERKLRINIRLGENIQKMRAA
jgi:hypothetical protein